MTGGWTKVEYDDGKWPTYETAPPDGADVEMVRNSAGVMIHQLGRVEHVMVADAWFGGPHWSWQLGGPHYSQPDAFFGGRGDIPEDWPTEPGDYWRPLRRASASE